MIDFYLDSINGQDVIEIAIITVLASFPVPCQHHVCLLTKVLGWDKMKIMRIRQNENDSVFV